MAKKKRSLTLSFAALASCFLIFVIGVGFGLKVNPPNKGPLMDRIRVIPPKYGHAPVRAETVATCKDVLEQLPPKMYRLLEQGGASINLAPNIEDNWPGSGDGRRPGPSDMTMGEEGGRCYGRDVWIYESEKVRGSHELKPPRTQDEQRWSMYQLLGHAINDCMGVMTNQDELTKLYNEDVANMAPSVRQYYAEETQDNHDSRALGCSEIIGALIRGDGKYSVFSVIKRFPRTTEYLRKKLMIED